MLAVVAVLVGPVVGAVPAAAYPSATVHLTGHGWGHGRGLGQYGALGYAIDQQQPYSQILDHYYGGTTKGSKADDVVTVRLTELDDVDMIVTSASAFQVDDGTGGAPIAIPAGTAVRVQHTSTGYDVFQAADCGGGTNHDWGQPVGTLAATAMPRVTTAYTGDDVTQMLRTCGPTGNVRSYRGYVVMVVSPDNHTWVINWVSMELYLRGVVPRESPASWGDAGGGKGIEALKAQAVAARSYAWAESRGGLLYKTCDTTACQVYGGAGLNGQPSEDPRSNAAVAATAGEVRMKSDGTIARTEFSSSTGGYTAGGQFPAVPDDGDGVCDTKSLCNPNHNWTQDVNVTDVQAAYPTIGTLQAVQITSRNGLGADGGRVVNMTLTGSSGKVTTTGNDFQAKLHLKSNWFTVVDIPIDITRLQGADRVATSIAVSKDLYPDGTAKAVVLASSLGYADALVGAPLAAAKSAPILLNGPDTVPTGTLAEITRAMGSSGTVYLLGGTAALGQGVEDQLKGAGYTVTRLGGANRFATATLVADALGTPTKVLEATGLNFPDALASGSAAINAGAVIVLTNGNAQAPETAAWLQGKQLTRYAIGGQAAAADPAATPVAGTDRYDTAVKVATTFFTGPPAAGLASGTTYPDALSGGVHAAHLGGPLVLTAPTRLTAITKQYLQSAAQSTLTDVDIYGGTAAVSDQVITDLRTR